MDTRISRRVGGVLLAVGVIGLVIMLIHTTALWPWLAALCALAIAAGLYLFWGGTRAALWVRTIAVFLLAASVVSVVAAPFFQPFDLTITEIRLDLADFAVKAAQAVFVLGVLLWVTLELGRAEVQDAILRTGIRRWDIRLPARVGAGIVALAGLMLWLTLHGQSAQLAESLAIQQLGPTYQYHLSWISSTNNGHGTSVSGVVTAWNSTEIKKVLLHWETH